jgi:hypothetical protein
MVKHEKFETALNFIMSFCVATVVALLTYFLSNGTLATITFETFLKTFLQNFAVSFLIGEVIPLGRIGGVIAAKI